MGKYIISSEELLKKFNEFIILDCRAQLGDFEWGHQEYLKEHISGSYFVNGETELAEPVSTHGGRHPLPDLEKLRNYFEKLGISDNSKVAVYGLYAGRTVFILRLFGIEAALISGTFEFLKTLGFKVDARIPSAERGKITGTPNISLIRDKKYVETKLHDPSVILIDSRAHERFTGESESVDKIAGHIPGAVNFPWEQIKNQNGEFLSIKKMKELYSFVDPSKEIIVYCGSGVTACYNWIGLKYIGINSSIYAGSWSDWISYEDTPKIMKGDSSPEM